MKATNKTLWHSPPHIPYKYRPGCGSVTLEHVKPELWVSKHIRNSPKEGPGHSVCKRHPSTCSLLSLPVLQLLGSVSLGPAARSAPARVCLREWVLRRNRRGQTFCVLIRLNLLKLMLIKEKESKSVPDCLSGNTKS